MNDYIHRLRVRLQSRTQDLINTPGIMDAFHFALMRYWEYISGDEMLMGILSELATNYPDLKEAVQKVTNREREKHFGTDKEQAAFAYYVIKHCAELGEGFSPEMDIAFPYNPKDPALGFRQYIIKPFFTYLSEQLEDGNHIIGSLIRYKEKVEWFRKQEIYDLYKSDTPNGEKRLIYHLYEYLFDEGIPFTIEPTSASGRPDLIGEQVGDNHLVADAKVYKDGSDTKGWLNQVYTYTQDYNEPVGYLVIYNVADATLEIESDDSNSVVPMIVYNHKTIFFVVVDIKSDRATASKRSQIKAVKITKNELIKEL